MTETRIRYIVDDVDVAVEFYTRHLGFDVRMRPGPGFAMIGRQDLCLLLNSPDGGGGAGRSPVPGDSPEPGGWNRFQIQVDDLAAVVDDMRRGGVRFHGDIITGRGGRQALVLDPAGNKVELFEAYG
ncbi:VOC family protein [Mycobacterium sp. GA-2829]|uniref:VOC family protein n=1 Tax=Mycobacterium sp. GA-2829 TaxID=1772283 RepID=UPI00073FD5AA|nr:VOC family protein [Mycobacterium sp. GA-2829]KUI35761.1 glyoxalase [Mycobacterium sp. GA-2829]